MVLNEVLCLLLGPFTFGHNPRTKSGYYNILSADWNFWHCQLLLAAWLADNCEYIDLHHLEWNDCFFCECPYNALGYYVPCVKQHPRWNHSPYRMLSDAKTYTPKVRLSSGHVHRAFNVYRHVPCMMSDLPMLDLLHPMQIGLLDNLEMKIFPFVKTHERLDK